MLTTDRRMWIAGSTWSAAATAVVAVSIALGASWSTSAVVLLMCIVPPIVLLLMGAGAPSPTVAELLHSIDAPKKIR